MSIDLDQILSKAIEEVIAAQCNEVEAFKIRMALKESSPLISALRQDALDDLDDSLSTGVCNLLNGCLDPTGFELVESDGEEA